MTIWLPTIFMPRAFELGFHIRHDTLVGENIYTLDSRVYLKTKLVFNLMQIYQMIGSMCAQSRMPSVSCSQLSALFFFT